MFSRSFPSSSPFPILTSVARARVRPQYVISTSYRLLSSSGRTTSSGVSPLRSKQDSREAVSKLSFSTFSVSAMTTTASTPSSLTHKLGMNDTSGNALPVWVATEPFEKRPHFPKLDQDLTSDIVIVGAGIAGISTAYELVVANKRVTLIEAREVLSGETGRTSGHLASFLDDEATELIKTFGEERAKKAYDSHQYALERIGQIAKAEEIECEYRRVPGRMIVVVPDTHPDYSKHNDLKKQYEAMKKLGLEVNYNEKGKAGDAYTGAILEVPNQALFHPTKYLNGLLKALRDNPLFDCYTHTRVESYKDHGAGKGVDIKTEGGHTIRATNMVLTTNVPLQEIEIIGKEAYYRTYCTAHRIPTGSFPDISLYDNGDPYIYVRKTASNDPSYEYLVVGGEDHKVAIESMEGYNSRFDKLAKWALAHYPTIDPEPEFKWSGQIVEPNDYMAYIGLNTGAGLKNVYVSTGDSGNGLTHGVIAGRLITDLLTQGNKEHQNPWADLYSPSRLPKPRTVPEVISENVTQQLKYARYIKTDVSDIESIPLCSGAVMHAGLSKFKKPLAVYRDGEGHVTTFSAICPHLQGVVAWNAAESTWDCPIHGSRFDGLTGKCIMGPAIHGLKPEDREAVKNAEGESG